MTPIETSPVPTLAFDDPSLRAAALNALGIAADANTVELRSRLLNRLEDDEFASDEPEVASLLLLSDVHLSDSQFAEVAEAAALAELQKFRDRFASLSPTDRRRHWNALQRYVPFVPLLTRTLDALEPGLDWELPDLAALSPLESQILEQALIQFTNSPWRRSAARIKFFSEAPVTSPQWMEAAAATLNRDWKLFQRVPDFQRELRGVLDEANSTQRKPRLHNGWTSAKQTTESSPSSTSTWGWWPIAFLVLTALRLIIGSSNTTPVSRPTIDSTPRITMPREVPVHTRLKNSGVNLGDLILGRRIGQWPSDETQSSRYGLELFLQQREAVYRKDGVKLSKEEALVELNILETLLEKYEVLPVDPSGRQAKVSIPLLQIVSRQLKEFVATEQQHIFIKLPPEAPIELGPSEALERLLGRKAPVINGVDLSERLDLTNELRDPEKVGERLRARAEAYRTNPIVKLTPAQLRREMQQLEHLLGAYAEHLGKKVDFPEETRRAARSLQIIGVQLQTALEKVDDATTKKPSASESDKESER